MTHLQQHSIQHKSFSSFEYLSFYFFRLFYLSTWLLSTLCFDPWIVRSHVLTNLFLSFWLCSILFGMMKMLVTVNKPCRVPHTLWITTWGTISKKTYLNVSNEWVQSLSNSSSITNDKTLPKNLFALRRKTTTRRKRKEVSRSRWLSFCTLNLLPKAFPLPGFSDHKPYESGNINLTMWPHIAHVIEKTMTLLVGTSHGKSVSCLVWCPWVFCKCRYNAAFNL